MKKSKKFKFAPLNNAFMGMSLIGLIVSVYYVANPTLDFGLLLVTFFLVLFFITYFSKKLELPYMIASVMGLIASLIFAQNPDPTWGVAFVFFFGFMFASSMVSMTVSDPDAFVHVETHSPTANKHSAKKRRRKKRKS